MKEYLKISLLPRDTNMHGTVFGGVIMSYLDLAGAHCARDRFDNRFVTVFAHEMRFLAPVYVGDLIVFKGEVLEQGKTSVTVDIKVQAERIDTRECVDVTEAKIVYVAVDGDGTKIPLKPRRGSSGCS